MSQISNQRLREIIIEEAKKILSEDAVDHVAVKDVVNKSADLITALAEFKEDASAAMMNALTPHLNNVEKALQNMLSTPGSYVSAPKKEPKVVSLRSTTTSTK